MANFQTQKQKILIENLLSSPDTFIICSGILKSTYFDPELRSSVDFILEYYKNYSGLPHVDIIKAETDVEFKTRQITSDLISYTSTEIETFCRRKALQQAVLASPSLIEKDDLGSMEKLIKEAMSISLTVDLGTDHFADPKSRIEQNLESARRYPMGINGIDELMGGGMARSELLIFCAVSGGGKSLAMANAALNYAKDGLHVVMISLELSEALISQRLDMMLTGIPSILVKQKHEEITEKVIAESVNYPGSIIYKRMSAGSNCNQIRAYLKEYELAYGRKPDVLVVDYLDLLSPNEKMSLDNVSQKDKLATEQLKEIGEDYNAIIITASQFNRDGIDADSFSMSMIAGGLTKTFTVDWQIAVVLTPAMKAAGEALFEFMKARSSDATGKQVITGWDNARLRFVNKKEVDLPTKTEVKCNDKTQTLMELFGDE